MNVLSLFDGMSCGQIALNELGIGYDNYYASEIDVPAMSVTKKNFPNTIHLGDVRSVNGKDFTLHEYQGANIAPAFSITSEIE